MEYYSGVTILTGAQHPRDSLPIEIIHPIEGSKVFLFAVLNVYRDAVKREEDIGRNTTICTLTS